MDVSQKTIKHVTLLSAETNICVCLHYLLNHYASGDKCCRLKSRPVSSDTVDLNF
jgi:hypothetical protein